MASITHKIPMNVGYKCKNQQEAKALFNWLETNGCPIFLKSHDGRDKRTEVLVMCEEKESLWFYNMGNTICTDTTTMMCDNIKSIIEALQFRLLLQNTTTYAAIEKGNKFTINEVGPFAKVAHIQNIKISTDFDREDVWELGRKGPYKKYVSYPITTEFDYNDLYMSKEAMKDMTDWCKPTHETITPAEFWNLPVKKCVTLVRQMSDVRFDEMMDYPINDIHSILTRSKQ